MDIEMISPEEITHIREQNIKHTLNYVYEHSPFYRRYYKSLGFHPNDFKKIEDLSKIPFIDRKILSQNINEMVCKPKREWIDICPTSGTTGKSIYFPMTARDLKFFAKICARGAYGLGITPEDTVQVMLTGDNLLQPTKIMTYMLQFEIGTLTLRAGPIGTERQIKIMQELKPNILFGIAPYLLKLGKSLKEHNIDPKELNLKFLMSTGFSIYYERWTPTRLHREIEEIFDVPLYSILGSTELNTGLWECPSRQGHHIPWDFYIPEIIDPTTQKVLPEGEQGELVLTLTGRETVPLIRYRTGDVTSIETSPCECGRKNHRIMAIVGRTDEMIKIKGTSVFPQQIEEAILSVEDISAEIVEVTDEKDGLCHLIITIDNENPQVASKVRERVKTITNITPQVKYETRENIEKIWYSEGRVKPRKFWDKRKKD